MSEINWDACDVYENGYGEVTLTWSPPGAEEPVFAYIPQLVEEAVATLAPMIQPLIMGITLDLYDTAFPFEERRDLSANLPILDARATDIPAYVHVKPYIDWSAPAIVHTSSIVQTLSQEWVAQALDHKSPEPTAVVSLSRLSCATTRSRLVDSRWSDAPELLLRDGAKLLGTIPVEHRDDGDWVAGPIVNNEDYLASYPPVWYEIHNDGWQLRIHMYIEWSFWGMLRYPEFHALVELIRALMTKGWAVDSASHFFEEVFLSGK